MLGLRPGPLCAELSGNDTAVQARIFMNRFAQTGPMNYPAGPCLPGWVHAHDGDWWPHLIEFVETRFGSLLEKIYLAIAIRAVKYGIRQNPSSFYAMLERFNSDSCTFYTPVGELGLALHEMHVVSGLSHGHISYEERYLPLLELNELKGKNLDIYETY